MDTTEQEVIECSERGGERSGRRLLRATMADLSRENKAIARTVAGVFGGTPRLYAFWDDKHEKSIDILSCEDRPQKGVTCYSTVGLSDCPLFKEGKEYSVRVEIVGACGSAYSKFENALATAAFCVINSGWFCCPGVVFPDVLAMYKCSRTMRHFMFVPPFLWEDTLETLDLGVKKIAWLLSVPISEKERLYAVKNGAAELEKLFVSRQIDIFNLGRPSEV